jgi:hypothetical protein
MVCWWGLSRCWTASQWSRVMSASWVAWFDHTQAARSFERMRATHADAKRDPAVAGVPSPPRYSRAITSVYTSGVATLVPGFSFSTSAIFAFE